MQSNQENKKELFKLISMAKNPEEAMELFTDLLTPQEIEQLAERWQLLQLLDQGVPQRDIAKRLNVSISKITRGSKVLKYGDGGIKKFLKRWR